MNKRRLARELGDADFVLRKVTGKGFSDLIKMGWDLWGPRAMQYFKKLPKVEAEDSDDLADCQLFGADNFFHHNVFKLALKLYREENHPDRFLHAELKQHHEQLFKVGEEAARRICQRRGWNLP